MGGQVVATLELVGGHPLSSGMPATLPKMDPSKAGWAEHQEKCQGSYECRLSPEEGLWVWLKSSGRADQEDGEKDDRADGPFAITSHPPWVKRRRVTLTSTPIIPPV